jgi:hypothetical protein
MLLQQQSILVVLAQTVLLWSLHMRTGRSAQPDYVAAQCLCADSALLLPAVQGDALQQQLAAASATEADLRKQLEAAVAEAATLQVRLFGSPI